MRNARKLLPALGLAGLITLSAVSAIAGPQKAKPKKPAAPKTSPALIAAGEKVFTKNCGGCHISSDKQNKAGKMGPALSHVGKFMSPAALESKIRNPKKTKPDTVMPAFGTDKISAKDMKALTAYLSSLK